jgi:plastocyanin
MKSSQSHIMAAAMAITSLLILCPGAASGTTVTVTVGNGGFFFTPSSVTIHPGDTVRWTWSSTGHSTTSGTPGHPSGLWDSGVLAQGAMFTHTFNSAGSFAYYCTPHGACCNMVGTVTVTGATPTPTPPPPPPPPPGAGTAIVADFNGDGHPDWVVRNAGTRQTAIWFLNNNVFVSGAFGPMLPVGWGLRGAADFNSDSHPDYGLFNSVSRQTAIWYLSGPTFIGSAFGPTPPGGWALVAAADFNGNGKPDYLLYNAGTRQTAIWYLNNNVFVSAAFGPSIPAGWSLLGQ